LTTFVFRGRQIRYMTPCIRYGATKIENFFFVTNEVKTILNGFWTCFGDFWFSRSANPLHDSMCKVWAKRIENLFFVSYALKMILNVLCSCFDDFCFSRSANPLHDSMYKVWAKIFKKLFLFQMLKK